jgi:mono/diheme cytochrome c family protein
MPQKLTRLAPFQRRAGPRKSYFLWLFSRRRKRFWLAVTLALIGLLGCQSERRQSDAELGLSPVQAAGRHLFDRQCGGCHNAYTSRSLKGPSLQGLFKRPYLKNGMPANEERVREIIVSGHNLMPAFQRALTAEQVDEIVAYLHTL